MYITRKLKRDISSIKNDTINKHLKELSDLKESEYILWKATKKFQKSFIENPLNRNLKERWDNIQKTEDLASQKHFFITSVRHRIKLDNTHNKR